MHRSLLELLACPHDGAFPLALGGTAEAGSTIDHGRLRCPQCARAFVVADGIADFVELEDAADELASIQRREIAERDKGYRSRPNEEREIERLPELDAVRKALGDCSGLTVLDAGCGRGELTVVLERARHVVAMDYSREGLVHVALGPDVVVDRVRASVAEMPLRDATIDAALSSQVLEHLPSAQLREAFVAELARVLKPGGRLVLTAYNWNAGRRGKGIPKEGFHQSGIFYHCFEPPELEQALATQFVMQRMWSIGVLLPFTYRLTRRLGRRIVYWDRLWRAQRRALPYGEVLLVQCERRAVADRLSDAAGGQATPSSRREPARRTQP